MTEPLKPKVNIGYGIVIDDEEGLVRFAEICMEGGSVQDCGQLRLPYGPAVLPPPETHTWYADLLIGNPTGGGAQSFYINSFCLEEAINRLENPDSLLAWIDEGDESPESKSADKEGWTKAARAAAKQLRPLLTNLKMAMENDRAVTVSNIQAHYDRNALLSDPPSEWHHDS